MGNPIDKVMKKITSYRCMVCLEGDSITLGKVMFYPQGNMHVGCKKSTDKNDKGGKRGRD